VSSENTSTLETAAPVTAFELAPAESILRQWSPLAVVHFTGNSDSSSFSAELDSLRRDLVQSRIDHYVEFRRQHYVVSVGSASPELLTTIAERTLHSWRGWCDRVPEIRNRNLDVLRN
jgi:hypothetical protein